MTSRSSAGKAYFEEDTEVWYSGFSQGRLPSLTKDTKHKRGAEGTRAREPRLSVYWFPQQHTVHVALLQFQHRLFPLGHQP